MAINPSAKFPTQTTTPSAEYPYGGAQDVTVPGDNTGTPYVADVLNDIFGFQQALLGDSGIVPSNNPEEVGASQYLQALFASSGMVRADYTVLRAIISAELSDGTTCLVTDRATGGEFTLDKTDTTSPDDGDKIIVGTDGARWKRLLDADPADLNRCDITTVGIVEASKVVTADSTGNVTFDITSGQRSIRWTGAAHTSGFYGGAIDGDIGAYDWTNLRDIWGYDESLNSFRVGNPTGIVNINSNNLQINGTNGVSGTFTTVDGKTVTVTKGIITNIV